MIRCLTTAFLLVSLNSSFAYDKTPEPYAVDSIRRLADTFESIREHYVESVSDEELINLAIHGMLEGLDPHSTYLEPEQLDELRENTEGEFSGLGLEVDMDGGLVRVISPIDHTPAAIAGIQSGDLIIKLDDTQVRGLSLNEAIDLMRGEKGSSIKLTILRDDAKGPIEIDVIRDTIKTNSVKAQWLEDSYAYVRIASFQQDTGRELEKQLESLDQKTIKGLILDLRNNPGGVLGAAVDVSDSFLNTGKIVYTEGRTDDAKETYAASEGDLLNGQPIVILLNQGSASASEIVAGALQDNKRAVIVGTRSFGKGSVQRVVPLSQEYAIKLTTSLYFTPSGRSIQAQGIIPDINVPQADVTVRSRGFSLTERSLPSHIEVDNNETEDTRKKSNALLKDDNQLTAALRILKGSVLFKPQG